MPLSARLQQEPYSYRHDPAVPPFPDDKALIVFDGVCVLCSGFAQFILARDRDFAFRMATAQSPLGQALFNHYGLDTANFETNLLIVGGRAYGKLDTVAVAAATLGGGWRTFGILQHVPRPIGDWLYDRIARNRYALFGRHDHCMIPPPHWKDRFLS